jgi:hypothetical protein
MIPVREKPEPENFEELVRIPGVKFLRDAPHPIEWKNHEYWRKILPEMCVAYNSICSYAAHWIPSSVGVATVDHFLSKDTTSDLAYEWKNYRLASLKLNARKKNFTDVLDPFKIGSDWFMLEFPGLQVVARPDLSDELKKAVEDTIKRLKLNDDDTCVQDRQDWLLPFCAGEITFDFLKRRAPFIAEQLERQGLVADIVSIMQRKVSSPD